MIIVHLGPSNLPIRFNFGGGIERRMIEIAKQQTYAGHKVIIYSANDNSSCEDYEGVEIRNIACRWSQPLRRYEYLLKAIHDLRGQVVDILHFHSIPEGAALSNNIKAKKFLSYDYFIFLGGRRSPMYWWCRNALQKFSCLLPVSEYCLQSSNDYWDFNGISMHKIYNGVNLEQFKPDQDLGKELSVLMG